MRSLRGRLLLGTAVGATAVLLAAGVALYLLVRMALSAEFDEALVVQARALTTMVEQDKDEVSFEPADLHMTEFDRADRGEYFEVWLADGRVLARSKSLRGGDLERFAGATGAPAFRTVALPDGRRGRLVGITFIPRSEDNEGEAVGTRPAASPVTLVLGRETAALDRTLARLRWLLGGVWAAMLAVVLGVLAWVVRRGLRPVQQLAAEIGRVDAADLSTRIRSAGVPEELLPLVHRLNELFARLEAAFQREKAFAADVAHDLRTPLAGLRTTLEVSLSGRREPARYRESMADCLAITRQMQAMVENLLSLARAESGGITIAAQPVDAGGVLDECWKLLSDRATARGLEVEWQTMRPCMLRTDREVLRQIVQNVFDNAVTHADTGGRVRIEAVSDDGRIRVRVSNTGSQLSQEQAQRAFDRFWRGDVSRADPGAHCGLGLSLCRRLTELLGGTIAVESAAGGMFTVTLEFRDRAER